MALGAVNYLLCEAFVVPNMGRWNAEPMRSPSSASVVIYGVPRDPEDHHAEMFLNREHGNWRKMRIGNILRT